MSGGTSVTVVKILGGSLLVTVLENVDLVKPLFVLGLFVMVGGGTKLFGLEGILGVA